jgi:peptidyl-prolyl cis-trans isomerase C
MLSTHRKPEAAAFIPCLIAAATLLLLTGCKAASPSNTQAGAGDAPPPVVATVNNRPISTRLYEMYLKNGREALGIDPATEDGKRKLELLKEGVVSELIDRSLIAQEAERRGLSISQDEMQQAEGRAMAEYGGERQFDEYLSANHLSRDEYREVIRWEIYGGKMQQEFSKEITVSDEDVKNYYDEHKQEAAFQLAERVTASHILIAARPNLIRQQLEREKNLTGEALEKAVREEINKRRAQAEELRRKAAAGADFAQLARESSEDPSSRDEGGSLGTFARNSHPKAFDDAAFGTRPGSVSPVVETDYGFHVIKVAAHEQARAQTFEEAAPEIRRKLSSQRLALRLREWLTQTRRAAQVRINEPFRFGSLRTEFPAM